MACASRIHASWECSLYLTGYGTQLKMIGDRLIDAGYPVGHAADFGYSGSKIEWEGRTLYRMTSCQAL